jgi:hypothetical protein
MLRTAHRLTIAPQPKNHERDTPTRVRVKMLSRFGVSRHAIYNETNVPDRTQRVILKGSD